MRTFGIIAILALILHLSSAVEFGWLTSQPGKCVASDTRLGVCSKPRKAKCVKKDDSKQVPDYYCLASGSSPKPASNVPCDRKECPQRCIVSTWSKWNPCDAACVRPFRYRIRSILWRDQTSGDSACPTLFERETCAHCTRRSGKEVYFWQVGEWGRCRKFKTVAVYQSPDAKATTSADHPAHARACGPLLTLGKLTRKVRCVDERGQEVEAKNCQNSKDKHGRITQRPEKSKVCRLPCDCRLSEWSKWSGCLQDCSVKEERRTRDVLYPPQLGGKPCGNLIEKRPCDNKTCTVYEWFGTPWGRCQTQSPPGSSNISHCGYGFQERLVFCIKSTGNNTISDIQPVQDERCDRLLKLVSREPCHIPCQDDCKVSEWQAWGPCSVDCEKSGLKKRNRTILVPARNGGKECPNLVEMQPCGQVNCTNWKVRMWSDCFDSGNCARPSMRWRPVFCEGFDGKMKFPSQCSRHPKPAARQNCSSPCGYDCAVSYWSEWGPCSKSCGLEGGIQMRYKKILAYPDARGAPCPSANQLTESRKCNQDTLCEEDSNRMWKTRPWSMCVPLVNGTCGIFKGIRKRVVVCGTYMKDLSNESLCAEMLKPAEEEPCNIPCPRNCMLSKWQEWSDCSQTCGSGGIQFRNRYILQEASHGGLDCPLAVSNGVQTEIRACRSMPACYQYKWNASSWTECKLLPQTKSMEKCGAGYQTRSVFCERSDKKIVNTSFCFVSLLKAPQSTLKACWKPCAQSCVQSDWSSWSPCPEVCTTRSPDHHRRTRGVFNLSPGRGGFPVTCPRLKAVDLSETEKCPTIPCFSYKWYTGAWESCVSDEVSSDCKRGEQERNVLCQRSDNILVSDMYCRNITKPVSSQSCSLVCSQDCIVSSWQNWSACSHACGKGIQVRNRIIVKPQTGLGRDCPTLTEKRLCSRIPCTSFKWSVSLWSTCKMPTNGSVCGNGTQTRQVLCSPDPTKEAICLERAPKPETMQYCELPCPGDCVLSNWGVWQDCTNGRQGCTQHRWRKIIRNPSSTSTRPCSNMLQQTQPCDCPMAGKLIATDWSTCQLNQTDGLNCGKGIQFQSVKCVGKKGQVLNDIYCSRRVTHRTSRDCIVKCPVDCVLSQWTMWSQCSKDCGVDGTIVRSRSIIVSGINGGKRCPNNSNLVQRRPCNGKPCYSYTLEKGRWTKCYVDGQGCGTGSKSRNISCRRSDGRSVGLYHCFQDMKRFSSDTLLQKLNTLQALLNNISKLSLLEEHTCIEPCPGNCDISEWSDWSDCGRTCFQDDTQTFQSRSRVIISKPSTGGKACPPELSETRKCQLKGNIVCIGAEWKVGGWRKNGTREVWCQTTNGLNVSGACNMEKRPSTTRFCQPQCSDPNAVCRDGECVCKSQFELYQHKCIPVNGCLHDGHCIFENTACRQQKCVCREGYALNATTGLCVWSQTNEIPTSTATTVAVERTTVTTIPGEDDKINKKALNSDDVPEDYLKWIGISVGVLLFCIVLVVGVFCYTRRQRTTKGKTDEKGNAIELVGMLHIKDGENPKPV